MRTAKVERNLASQAGLWYTKLRNNVVPERSRNYLWRDERKVSSLMDIIVPQKYCSLCTSVKPLTDFYKNRTRPDGLRRECIKCTKELGAKRKRPNDITKGMRAVGFNRAAYDKVWHEQGGTCAICHKPETGKNQWGVKRLAVDHDHATGQFRGLLCYSCNVKLGVLEDQKFMIAASEYMKQSALARRAREKKEQ